ncbi:MAG: SDR family NAD(P)-dependent oxidoreductase [Deltaproteobacteria bacterium]|nr:SDR family NAD(P)-dependent oxidoreductase [Deltaproteobacteria bacterium]
MATAIVIGASSGIGEALARRLAGAGWQVVGMARRAGPTGLGERYRHVLADVRAPDFTDKLADAFVDVDACVYCTGIGELLELPELAHDRDVFATNLVGMVAAAEVAIPRMLSRGKGHFIGLSSQADRVVSDDAPSYAASKAGMSSYLEGLAYACKGRGVAVTNVRFGFVDTAMAKSTVKPFMITADKAARVVERALVKRPIRITHPWRMAALLWMLGWGRTVRTWLS